MLCAAAIEIGPARETFWALWDREERALREHTRHVVPVLAGPEVELRRGLGRASAPATSRSTSSSGAAAGDRVRRAPPGDGGYTWTRKLAGRRGRGRRPRRRLARRPCAAARVDDLLGRLPRRGEPRGCWSAGVGEAADGRRGRLEPRQRHQRPGERRASGRSGSTARRPSPRRSPSTASTRSASTTARCSGSSPRPRARAPRGCRSSSAPTTRRRSARSRARWPGSSSRADPGSWSATMPSGSRAARKPRRGLRDLERDDFEKVARPRTPASARSA